LICERELINARSLLGFDPYRYEIGEAAAHDRKLMDYLQADGLCGALIVEELFRLQVDDESRMAPLCSMRAALVYVKSWIARSIITETCALTLGEWRNQF
jgi:hypothetical protein